MASTLRTETESHVRSIWLTRAKEYNTLTPELRDELAKAIDEADADADVHVILLRAEGPAFCAGYGLDWSTAAQAGERARKRVWDSVADLRMISTFVDVYMKLWYARKPTIAAVQGWCIGGGTDMVLEFVGPGAEALTIDERLAVANMAVEIGRASCRERV